MFISSDLFTGENLILWLHILHICWKHRVRKHIEEQHGETNSDTLNSVEPDFLLAMAANLIITHWNPPLLHTHTHTHTSPYTATTPSLRPQVWCETHANILIFQTVLANQPLTSKHTETYTDGDSFINSPWRTDGPSSPRPVKGPQWFIDFFICHIKKETCTSSRALFFFLSHSAFHAVITSVGKKEDKITALTRRTGNSVCDCTSILIWFLLTHPSAFYYLSRQTELSFTTVFCLSSLIYLPPLIPFLYSFLSVLLSFLSFPIPLFYYTHYLSFFLFCCLVVL